MGAAYSSATSAASLYSSYCICFSPSSSPTKSKAPAFSHKSTSNFVSFNSTTNFLQTTHLKKLAKTAAGQHSLSFKCGRVEGMELQKEEASVKPVFDPHNIEPELLQEISYDALVWCSLHGLVVGDRNSQVNV